VTARDNDSVRRMLYQGGEKLSILATGAEALLDVAPTIAQFEEVLTHGMGSYPVVIVDLSGAIPSVKKAVLARAHETVVVTTPSLSALRTARTLAQEIKNLHGGFANNIHLLVNMAGVAQGKDVSSGDIKSALDMEPAAILPFDPKVFYAAENEGRKIGSDKAGQDVIARLLPLLQKLVSKEAPVSDAGKEDGLIGSLLGRIKVKK
jgi:pilus assembly protein CpaE